MFSAEDLISLMNEAVDLTNEDQLFELGPYAILGEQRVHDVFEGAYGMSADELADVITDALDETDEACEPIVDEFIIWLDDQEWLSDDEFKKLITKPEISPFVSGYRIVDGNVINADEMEDA